MTQYVINIGALPNDGTGDPLRTAFNETNLNFNQVFAAGPVLSNIQIANNTILTTNTNGNLVLAPNGVGIIQSNQSIIPSIANVRNLGSADRRWNTVYTQYANIITAQIATANIANFGNLTIPVANLHILGGTNGYVLQTDGLGNLTWTAQTGGSGNGTPGGANTQIQFNNAGSFGGSSFLTWDSANAQLNTVNFAASEATIYGNVAGVNGQFSGDVNGNNFTVGTVYSPNYYGNAIVYANATGYLTNTNLFKYNPGTEVLTVGAVSTTGNITSNYFIGDGSLLTNLPSGSPGNILYLANAATSNSAVDLAGIAVGVAGNVADFVYSGSDNLWETSAGLLINTQGNQWLFNGDTMTSPDGGTWTSSIATHDEYINSAPDGFIDLSSLHANLVPASFVHLEQTQAQMGVGGNIWTFDDFGNLTTPGSILPDTSNVYSLGSQTAQWKDLWVSNNTIYLNSVPITLGAGNVLEVDGNAVLTNDSNTSVSTTGNITANSFVTTANLYMGPDANVMSGGDNSQIKQFGELDTLSVGWDNLTEGSATIGQMALIDFNTVPGTIRLITGNGLGTTNFTTVNEQGDVTTDGNLVAYGTVTGAGFAYSNGQPILANLTVADTTLSTVDPDTTLILQAYQPPYGEGADNIIRNQVRLDSNNGLTQVSARSSVQTAYFEYTIDWAVGTWTGTHVDLINAPNVIAFVSGIDWAAGVNRSISINGGAAVPYDGASYDTNNITFHNVGLADPNPTNVTSLQLLFQYQSSLIIDYEDAEEIQLGGDLGIRLQSLNDINIQSQSTGLMEADQGLYLRSLNAFDPVQITANVNGSAQDWIFGPTGNLQIPGAITSINSIDLYAGDAVSITSNNTGAVNTWLFDESGNLTLPGNTFAVNYANGDPVTFAGGGASLGDLQVTGTEMSAQASAIQDRVEISGTAMGWAYLQLPTNGNANVLNTRLHNDAGNVEIGTGNLSLGLDIFHWTFDKAGNLNLPRSAVIYEKSSPTGLGNTLALRPSRNDGDAEQELLIYPTGGEGNHLHLATGNLWYTELYMGSDDYYVRLSTNGNIGLRAYDNGSNVAYYSFNADGTVSWPNQVLQAPDGEMLSIYATSNAQADVAGLEFNPNTLTSNIASYKQDEDKIVQFQTQWGGGNTSYAEIQVADQHWFFNENGNLTVPGNIIMSTGIVGSGASPAPYLSGFSSVSAITVSALGNITAGNVITTGSGGDITMTGGNITGANVVSANTFVSNAFNVVTAGNLSITSQYGLGFTGTILEDNGTLELIANGGGGVVAGWDSTYGNGLGNIATINFNEVGGEGILLRTGNRSATEYNWNFDSTGNLTLPGNTFSVNYANGTPVSLGGGGYGNANVATFLADFGSNAISTTGNIQAGNISASGNVIATGNANVLALTTRNGDSNNSYTSPQIIMGYAGTADYPSFIHTTHNASTPVDNTIEFWTSDGTQAGTFPANAVLGLTVTNGNIKTGNISATGNITGNYFSVVGNVDAGSFYTTGNVTAIGAVNTPNVVITKSFVFNGLYGNANIDSSANFSTSGNVTAGQNITTPKPLANLTPVAGARAFVNNANLVAAGNFGNQISGGGSNTVPVWSDGTNWYIG